MKIIFGLGNPGLKYKNTRHNAGFLWLDFFAKKYGFPDFTEKKNALVSEGSFNGEKLMLVKPLSFMNLSGQVVKNFIKFYKFQISDFIVVYDDIDFEIGKFKFKEKGSAGTHNGMKSIVAELGSQDFARLRLGIESRGKYAFAGMPLDAFVLSPFAEEELVILDEVFAETLKLFPENT